MLDRSLAEVDKEYIASLAASGIPEGRSIEYKRELPARGEEDKREFLADVSSFANAAGGCLIFGVVEAQGKPQSVPGLAGINSDQEIQRLENVLRDSVEPRIPGIQMKAIEGFSAGPAIVVRIPRSWAGPHMIKGSPRFFSRNSNGKAPLDATEIRAAFLHSAGLADRVRQFRDDRVGRILAGETPIPLSPSSLVVLHVIPLSLWASGEQIDVADFINQTYYLPTIASGGSPRPNLDGFLTYSQGHNENSAGGYAQLFRHGAVETVTGLGLGQSEDGPPYIAAEWLEKLIVHGIQDFRGLFSKMNIEGESVVFLSLLGVRGSYLYAGRGQRDIVTAHQDNFLFPELLIADANATVSTISRPLLDHLWQAFGFPASPNYFPSGDWRFEGRS